MARDRRYADVAVDDAMETQAAIDALDGVLRRVARDGVITPEEQALIDRALASCKTAAAETTRIAEQSNIAELVHLANGRTNGVNTYLRKRAEAVGLPLVVLSPNLPRTPEALPEPETAA